MSLGVFYQGDDDDDDDDDDEELQDVCLAPGTVPTIVIGTGFLFTPILPLLQPTVTLSRPVFDDVQTTQIQRYPN